MPVSYTHLDVYKRQGLYLARNITQAHGGKLWISSSSRSGTCFTLALPAAGEESA